jgi:ADP-ribose pyrophosphatase
MMMVSVHSVCVHVAEYNDLPGGCQFGFLDHSSNWQKVARLRTIPGNRRPSKTLMSQERFFETLSRRYVWRSRWYSVRQDQLRAPDGSEFTYTVIEKPHAVWIVPVTAGGEIVLIDQYRYPIGDWCLEIPSGNVEPEMDAAAMAARELREEIGGTAQRFVRIGDFYTMNGIGDEIAEIYLALGVALGEPQREITEVIRLRAVPVDEALDLARAGAIKDGPSALAILLSETALRAYLAELRS